MVAACMAGNMRIEQIAELHPAFPTFTEAVSIAAQKIVRYSGLPPMAPGWGDSHSPAADDGRRVDPRPRFTYRVPQVADPGCLLFVGAVDWSPVSVASSIDTATQMAKRPCCHWLRVADATHQGNVLVGSVADPGRCY
jgi:hypothetical protein